MVGCFAKKWMVRFSLGCCDFAKILRAIDPSKIQMIFWLPPEAWVENGKRIVSMWCLSWDIVTIYSGYTLGIYHRMYSETLNLI